ncbi:hypothetical protein ACHAWF_007887, partial [Thalassiosira exigua]
SLRALLFCSAHCFVLRCALLALHCLVLGSEPCSVLCAFCFAFCSALSLALRFSLSSAPGSDQWFALCLVL